MPFLWVLVLASLVSVTLWDSFPGVQLRGTLLSEGALQLNALLVPS